MRLAGIVCLSLVAGCFHCQGSTASAEGRFLGALRREVDEPSAPASPDEPQPDRRGKPPSSRNGRLDDCQDRQHKPFWSITLGASSQAKDDEDDNHETVRVEQVLGWAILFGVTSPWWVPNTALESADDVLTGFPVAPYANGGDGYLVFGTSETDNPAVDTRPWGGRLSFDAASNFEGVTTSSGRLRIDTDCRFGLDTEWATLFERNAGDTDWLGRGDCNLVVRFAQSPRVEFHSGIGINWLADQHNADVGFNFTYGVDVFPLDPVVTSATLDLGKVGDASLIHFRGTVGVMVMSRMHLYTGYDLLDLEGASVHSFLTGIEFWF